MNAMSELSNGLAEAVKRAEPGVVQVNARRRLPATGIAWTKEIVVTAHHVVRSESIRVGLPDGSHRPAELVGRDPGTDLAVLRVSEGGLTPLERHEGAFGVGNLVLALGRPGRTVQATLGVVSALGGSWRTARGGEVDRYLQTDVLMYPGFSGGPLIAAEGRLLGLNTSALMSGVSLALPLETVERVVGSLMAHGRVRRGFLGVSTQRVELPAALADKIEQATGLLVVTVEPDSPADLGGLLLGDTIVELDGVRVSNHRELVGLLSGDRVDRPVNVQVIRGGEVVKLTVTIGERS
jgi:S1-C subfamily serine protease